LSITHHTRKRPSTGPRTTHGPQCAREKTGRLYSQGSGRELTAFAMTEMRHGGGGRGATHGDMPDVARHGQGVWRQRRRVAPAGAKSRGQERV
jgi:hypothetical protein